MPTTASTPKMGIDIGTLHLHNPVTVCSGTFGAGESFTDFFDLNRLGAVTTKGVSLTPWEGNDAPRIAETASGMLNSIGLQNPGVEFFCRETLPWLKSQEVPIIVNVSGHSFDEYLAVIERLEKEDGIGAYELNISCPNVDAGGMAIGVDRVQAAALTTECRKATSRTLIVKLSPNVTDITSIARAVCEAGADALSLINTVLGMAIDAKTRRPKLARIVGGLSGPAIKPIALRMVWQVHQAVSLPIIGMGGIASAEDAIEFFLAGASVVAVGTSNFVNPSSAPEIVEGIIEYCRENGFSDYRELIGALQV